MKNKLFLLLITVSFTLFSSCEKTDPDTVCIGFDQRQCGVDEWADLVPISDSASLRETKMKDYLESKNISIKDISLLKNFYDSVCEACGVCPEQDRFVVRINMTDKSVLESLDFLGTKNENCSDYFN